jgi:hypothetical protein
MLLRTPTIAIAITAWVLCAMTMAGCSTPWEAPRERPAPLYRNPAGGYVPRIAPHDFGSQGP